jgi:hypothetical protein
MSTPEPAEPVTGDEATVQEVGDWHLVTYGGWQISVAPDGLLMLPRHLHPRECDDFVGAVTAAAKVGAQVIADNQARGETDDRSLPPTVIVREGPPPAGARRMVTATGPNLPQAARASIGRARRNGVRPRGTTI